MSSVHAEHRLDYERYAILSCRSKKKNTKKALKMYYDAPSDV
jgi:hypothetical protein